MTVIGAVLLAAVLLVVRGRLMKLAFRRGGKAVSAQGGEETFNQRGCSAK